MKRIGIIGAGKLGITMARIARAYDFEVAIAGSGDPKKIALSVEVLAPGAVAMTAEDVAKNSEVILLALPLGKFRTLPKQALAGKLVIDSMNHWWEVDGDRNSILPTNQSSSEAVQEFLADSRVVKAFNHIGYHDLFDNHKPNVAQDRKAMAVAGDNDDDTKIVGKLVGDLGFNPLIIGKLSEGARLEPGTSAFGANIVTKDLESLLRRP